MNPTEISIMVALTIKICALIGLGLYAIFAGIIVRQEQLMAAVLEEGFEPILRLLTIIHFAAALGLLVLTVIIL